MQLKITYYKLSFYLIVKLPNISPISHFRVKSLLGKRISVCLSKNLMADGAVGVRLES